MNDEIPEALRSARRSLEELTSQIVSEDWIWDESIAEWCLPFTARIASADRIPEISSWVFAVSPAYPDGKVRIYPALNGGIEETYPHQSNNGLEEHGKYCRSGNVCLFTENAEWALRGNADFTLLSHAERFLEWIKAANEGSLMKTGDNLEFPMQNIRSNESVLYCEDEVSKMIWDSHPASCNGVVETIDDGLGHICLSDFYGADGYLVRATGWGTTIERNAKKKDDLGIWFIASSVPHIRCWQSPNTYGELREWANKEGLDIDSIIARNSSKLRDGLRHYLAIGVPCANVVGKAPDSLSWFIAKMPVFSEGKEFGKGGVHKKSVLKTVDRQKTFASTVEIDWITSANCAKDQIHSRGALCDKLTDSRVALIGAGSLGSIVANNLVRGGVTDLCIFDSDRFGIGNTTRHLLRTCDVGSNKAVAVASSLNAATPMGQLEGRSAVDESNAESLKGFDVIIDCSSSPSVLAILDGLDGDHQLFVCSFGYAAEKVYISASSLNSFSLKNYYDTYGQMMREDATLVRSEKMPWEGIGCWSPVFPAKNSDVSRAASLVVDCLDCLVKQGKTGVSYAYITKRDKDGVLLGIEREEL
ncbi:hypothetical protein C2L80_04160 [Rubneribacter badeniensis]|uniref:Uncharacterized protein n=1 Tax=Rubneribacter badeniensis TaxID=2070688 RepID=A0A2K2U6C0_9ACTN|nr:ThiF family adenylyltransferase [Rubneribacter badeniensis]PNV65866.1 hypothetical protein C2L80_04160 [Rubneribacter badeniensis]